MCLTKQNILDEPQKRTRKREEKRKKKKQSVFSIVTLVE